MSRRIALVRHPPVDIAPGICYGRLDIGLAAGAADAIAAIREALGDLRPVRVWTSPSVRCRIVAEAIGAAPVLADPRLMELDFGGWEGVAWDDVPRAELDRWALDPGNFRPGGGESGNALVARVTVALDAILSDAGDVVIVSHGGPLRILSARLRVAVDLLAKPQPLGSVEIVTQRLPPTR